MQCPICSNSTIYLDTLDLSKTCLGLNVLLGNNPIEYYFCRSCGFTFAPNMHKWTTKQFSASIYNSEYVKIDPDYLYIRPTNNAEDLLKTFKEFQYIKHLDYGGGSGLLSNILREHSWDSSTYDPFSSQSSLKELVSSIGLKFNLITAFEVFEHSNNPKKLLHEISSLLSSKGILIFSTMLSDKYIKEKEPLNWWYASPRNGHISLYSQRSLRELAQQNNLNFLSFSENIHAMWKKVPKWATHIIKQ